MVDVLARYVPPRIKPAEARGYLEPAFAMFEQMGGELGQVLSAIAIIEAHVNEWMDYHPH